MKHELANPAKVGVAACLAFLGCILVQPARAEPAPGEAVRVTWVPKLNEVEQVAPHVMPAGALPMGHRPAGESPAKARVPVNSGAEPRTSCTLVSSAAPRWMSTIWLRNELFPDAAVAVSRYRPGWRPPSVNLPSSAALTPRLL